MHVGFGSTVFLKGISTNKLDGIGTYTKQLSEHLTEYNNELTLHPFRFNLPHTNVQGKKLFTFNHFQLSLALSTFLKKPFLSHKKLEQSINLLHATDHYIPKLKNTPVVATIMDAIPLSHPEWTSTELRKTKNFFWKQSVKWADRVITISNFSKLEIIEHFDIDAEKIDVIPLGVNNLWGEALEKKYIQGVKNKYQIADSFLISVGTLQPRKNTLRLIEAFQALHKDIRKNTQLIIVGRLGWGCNDVIEKLKSLEQQKNIVWLNYLEETELRALIQSATAIVHPSLYEGFGLPVLEAFSAGIPVVTSNITALPEVAENAAVMINPYDIESISDGMQNILESGDDFRNMLIARGKARAQLFSWESTAKDTLEIYKKTYEEFNGKC